MSWVMFGEDDPSKLFFTAVGMLLPLLYEHAQGPVMGIPVPRGTVLSEWKIYLDNSKEVW